MITSIKKERERLGLTQIEVAQKIGVGKATYVRWEKGSPVPSDKLAELHALGFDVFFIVTGNKQSLTVVDNALSVDRAVDVAVCAAEDAILAVYQAKKVQKKLDSIGSLDAIKNLSLILRSIKILAQAEFTGELKTDLLHEELSKSENS